MTTIKNYRLGKELGRGAFGVTFSATDLTTGKEVALKAIDIQASAEKGAGLDEIMGEIEILKDLSSKPNCYKYIACYYESFRGTLDGKDTYFIAYELVDGGSVKSFLDKLPKNPDDPNFYLSVDELWRMMYQMAEGLLYVHNKGYAHRDIKPDNIMLMKDGTVKYIDFGITCLKKCEFNVCNDNCRSGAGTLIYLPPEFFNGRSQDKLAASQAHDIWSLGVVFYELANRAYPFDAFEIVTDASGNRQTVYLPQDLIMDAISTKTYPSKYPLSTVKYNENITNFVIDSMLMRDWYGRPTAQDLYNYINSEMVGCNFDGRVIHRVEVLNNIRAVGGVLAAGEDKSFLFDLCNLYNELV